MNDANAPLNNLDFPNVMSPGAAQRQESYSRSSDSSSLSADTANVEALITLVQDLNQQNHELLNRITVLEGGLEQTDHSASESGPPPFAPGISITGQASEDGSIPQSGSETFSPEQVSHLLNQLEFAQQANQRHEIRVESLSTQLNAYQTQVAQLESENDELQQRCGEQLYHLNHLGDECRDLRLRLQRQQRYTLQFKAALEKCLEVPPPSYGFFHGHDYAHDMVDSPQSASVGIPAMDQGSEVIAVDQQSEDGNWLVQPLFPKIRTIKPWGTDSPNSEALPTGKNETEDWGHGAENKTDSSDGIRLGIEDTRTVSLNTTSGAGSFSGDRFQSTLLTLANEAQQDAPWGDSPSLNPGLSPGLNVEPESVSLSVEPENSSENAEVPQTSEAQGGERQDAAPVESVGFDESISMMDGTVEQKIESADVPAPAVVANEKTVEAHDAIAPFSSVSFAAPEPSSPSDQPSDDKLWQSLVNLIDMSTADGLQEPSPDHSNAEGEGAGIPHRPASTLANPWFEDEDRATDSAVELSPTSNLKSLERPSIPPLAFGLAEQNKLSVETTNDSEDKQETGDPEPSTRRVIELPPFITPRSHVNPNPV